MRGRYGFWLFIKKFVLLVTAWVYVVDGQAYVGEVGFGGLPLWPECQGGGGRGMISA